MAWQGSEPMVWIACAWPFGKYQRSPGPWFATSVSPSGSTTVTWQWPAKMYAHSAELCQCISRTPPGLRYRCAPAMSVAIGNPLVVMSRAQPPEVALIGDLSREAVKVTGSPVRRGMSGTCSLEAVHHIRRHALAH